ncbi:MAG: retropepsin-like domain-containing protein, partial [Candidatus Eremiobacteraeota bacterium]|nr:retropepsin-like domain-containing protein [Candidatus Eremiobacteraeota bacterium]
ATVAAAPPPDPLAALAAANGHPAAVHLRATAKRVVEGRTILTTLDQLGAQRLVRRCVGEVCSGTWFDGRREWAFGLNEIALPQEGDETLPIERTLFAIASCAFAEPAFRAAGGTAARDGAGRWRVRARDGTELIAVIDPATQAVRRVETAAGRPIAVYGREARAGGAAFALDRASPFEAGAFDEVAVVPGPLGPPAGAVPSFSGDAPLALGDERVPIVPCSLGGRNARCLLDTGATPSAITLPLAEALKLEPHGELEIAGLGRFATGFVEAGPLALGPARFERARFAVIPPSAAAKFDVVVGSDLLGRVRLVLDRARSTARVLPSGGAAAGQPNTVPVAFRNGAPVVQAMLGPEGTGALLDTGDEATVSFGYAAYRKGPQWPVVSRGTALGVAGADDTFTVDVPDVQVGPLALGTVRATVRRTQASAHVGIGLWDRFVVDVDEGAGRVALPPRR